MRSYYFRNCWRHLQYYSCNKNWYLNLRHTKLRAGFIRTISITQCFCSYHQIILTTTYHESYGVSNHQQMECLFKNFSMLTSWRTTKLHINAPGLMRWVHSLRASNTGSNSMPFCHHNQPFFFTIYIPYKSNYHMEKRREAMIIEYDVGEKNICNCTKRFHG